MSAAVLAPPLDAPAPVSSTARLRWIDPIFVLRNHLAEAAIRQAREGHFSEVHRLHRVLRHPFDEQEEHSAYAASPPEWAQGITASCSS